MSKSALRERFDEWRKRQSHSRYAVESLEPITIEALDQLDEMVAREAHSEVLLLEARALFNMEYQGYREEFRKRRDDWMWKAKKHIDSCKSLAALARYHGKEKPPEKDG